MSEFERQAAAREILGGEWLHARPAGDSAKISQDSIFQMSVGASGTTTPSVGVQQTIQSNTMSAPPPKEISASALPQYEVEELEQDPATASR